MKEQEAPKYDRFVIKLRDEHELDTDDVENELRKRQLIDVDKFLGRYNGLRFLPHDDDRQRTERLIKEAQANNPNFVPPKFFTYFVVLVPHGEEPREIEAQFRQQRTVEKAYHVPPARSPTSVPFGDPWLPNQNHHRPSNENGVDSFCAWSVTGGLGDQVSFVDIELGGWALDHQDLNDGILPDRITRIGTEDGVDPDHPLHGTEVLGVVVGWQNNKCGVGVAPGAKDPRISSIQRAGFQDVPNTIKRCADNMTAGDVMLLEVEQPLVLNGPAYPVEVLSGVYDAIVTAVGKGIVVIEAAGNSAVDLDLYTDGPSSFPFNPAGPGFKESGAIIVGAANSADLARRFDSNHGARVDVFSWGDGVMTAFTAPDFFNTTFSGTSAASAIIAGVAVVIQSIRLAATLPHWTSTAMRSQLKATANSIPSMVPGTDRIGRQPDLSKLMQSIGVTPADVYARDNLADVGLPHGGSIASSPDVLFTSSPSADPQAAWGEGSGQEDAYVGGTIDSSLDHHLYLRVRNRGSVEAKDVKAWLYWADSGTLVLPSSWNFIDEVTAATIPVGDTAHVLGPALWSSINIPADGHYCFIALLGADCDPMPDPASILTLTDYTTLIRNENNAVWRNFNIVTPAPAPSPSPSPGAGAGDFRFEFFGAGAPDRAMFMMFDVEARLPKGALVGIEVPPQVAGALGGIRPDRREIEFMRLERDNVPRRIAAQGRTRLGGLHIPRNRRIPFVLQVHIPRDAPRRGRISVVQRLKSGEEIGRISWRIDPPCPSDS